MGMDSPVDGDDAGENVALRKLCKNADDQLFRKIKFEFTPRDTPQHNDKMERKFQTIHNRVRANCEAAGLTGIHFNPDVSNPIGEGYGTEQ